MDTNWKAVPVKLTPEMRTAAAKAAREYMEETGCNNLDVIWRAALDAAPVIPHLEKPLCSSALSFDEALRFEAELAPVMRYLGRPGDWGYGTKLGELTITLHKLREEIKQAGKDAAVREASDEAR